MGGAGGPGASEQTEEVWKPTVGAGLGREAQAQRRGVVQQREITEDLGVAGIIW